ncbi:ABC transporter substrate-binding protein [Bosea sp. 62]|nr:ABC transporter substrate-binding protein [Bosea sp. 46]CAD5257721.1 ABC transporter substrate-binding protein [Bosea sp. 21B]CAD5283197.1 ABC transporter substrate-binding protein [Bosea sp. 7B]VVT52170.1 Carbohydrate ABC transporter substrate-binding protein, CUT1 family [Bosea sp. EC-HK365B]VXB37652.1 ABC transporter substrate-binding protein [Bosea sp. 29B]VXB81205.1 ABC transporter substrate-binding protein [Bosea sp. 125]VXC59150.1 ABC transporter substrate-binding protein [Bosea sp.
MRCFRGLVLGIAMSIGTIAGARAQAVEIEYWQYVFDARIKAMNELIKRFEVANPGIKVKHTTFPYADYQTKIAAAVPAGQGPDVVQLYYGWLDNFVGAKFIQPLPRDAFPHDVIEKEFYPIVQTMKRDGEYYGLPTAVRTLALFYNKKLFQEAGLDPNKPPQTLDDYLEAAKKTVKRDAAGNMLSAGAVIDMPGQDLHWWREVLLRQMGGKPYSDDNKTVAYDSEAGAKALNWYADLQRVHKVGQAGFMDEGQAAFRAGRAAMTVDGSFRLGAFGGIKNFEWGVAELPASADGKRSNFASYWVNAITAKPTGAKLEAAKKFMAFTTSPEAMQVWLDMVGELPARKAAAETEKNLAHPIYGPFLKALNYSQATIFVDELAQRQVGLDMANRVFIQNQDAKTSLAEAAKAEQAILDRFYKK